MAQSNYGKRNNNNKNSNNNNYSKKKNTNYGKNGNKKNENKVEIYAPFNFVPIPDKERTVFHPDWYYQISHDIPFKDGLNGEIKLTLNAETPIFTKDPTSLSQESAFCRLGDGTYFIPATTIKGCIRNVLEILSFSKMSVVANKKFETKAFKYNNSLTTHTVIPEVLLNIKDDSNFKPDLAECIFGYTTKSDSLKGRVQFGHAFAQHGTARIQEDTKSFQAYSPHPSYYPIYSQDGISWDKQNACIAGWKRYLIQNVVQKNNNDRNDRGNAHDTAKVRFLEKGVKFDLTIKFNNLKSVELGALLAAITFNGNNNDHYHNLGFGKPYGYGKIKISDPILKLIKYNDEGIIISDKNSYKTYLDEFKALMNNFIDNWKNTKRIKELLAIAGGWNKSVGYMSMQNKEFKIAKERNLALKRFSILKSQSVSKDTPPPTQQKQLPEQTGAGNKEFDKKSKRNNNNQGFSNFNRNPDNLEGAKPVAKQDLKVQTDRSIKKENINTELGKPQSKDSTKTTVSAVAKTAEVSPKSSSKSLKINVSNELTATYLGNNKVKIKGEDYESELISTGGKLKLDSIIGKEIVVKVYEFNNKKTKIKKVSFLKIKD